MAGKSYKVRVPFTFVDRKSGKSTRYEVNDTYAGDRVEQYLLGVDGKGPLIVEVVAPASAPSSKEK